MSDATVIKEFLVSLGFRVDKIGLDTFVKGITAASGAVLASVTAISDNLEKLYFASLRTRASAENIRAFGFAMGQMGSSASAALETIENLARFMRNSPGASGLIQSLGVQTRDANGGLRDTAEILQDLGKQFANMPYYRANAYAQALGIDEKTLMAMRQGLGDFGDEYKHMLAAAGLDLQAATKNSHEFMNETRTLGAAFVILGQKVVSTLNGSLRGDIKHFREGLVDNFGRISGIITKVIKGILFLADMISTLAFRAMQVIGGIVDWFNGLDDSTKRLVEGVVGLLAAWRLLNAGFLATPLGMLAAIGVALLALYDDYKVWKDGGKSLINWSTWDNQIEKALFGLSKLGRALRGLGKMASDAWSGNWGALAKDWGDVKSALSGNPVEHGLSQQEIDSVKDRGGAKLTNPRDPRGIRNNNPGNLNYVGQHGAMKESGPNGRFAVFGSAEEGLQALSNQLRLYGTRGINSVRSIISKFAPPSENNTQAYINSVSGGLGVDSNAALNLNDPRVLQSLMGAIIKVENGKNPYSAEMIAAASGARAAGTPGSTPVSMNQTTTIQVTGSGDPHATANAVAQAQSGVNQRLVRNMRSAAQ